MTPTDAAPPPVPPSSLLQEASQLLKWKISILEKLDTKTLVAQLHTCEDELSRLQTEELKFKTENRGYIASAGEDCQEAKQILAQLWLDVPPLRADGQKATQSDKEAWLRQQRTQNQELRNCLTKQAQVLAGIEQFRLDIEAMKRKYEATLAVLRLKTAQIEFLSRSL